MMTFISLWSLFWLVAISLVMRHEASKARGLSQWERRLERRRTMSYKL